MIYYFLDVSISARHLTELPKKPKKQYNTFFYYNQIVFCFVIAYNTAENIEIIFYSLLNKQKGTPKQRLQVEQELLTLWEHMSSRRFLVRFVLLDLQFYMYVLQIVVCPFVLFLLANVLSVLLLFTDSNHLFGIFKLFFLHSVFVRHCTVREGNVASVSDINKMTEYISAVDDIQYNQHSTYCQAN